MIKNIISVINTLLFSLLIYSLTFATCKASIDGMIIDADTKEPIADAIVVAYWMRDGLSGSFCYAVDSAITDNNGEYKLKDGPRRLRFGSMEPSGLYAHKSGYHLNLSNPNAGYMIFVSLLETPIGALKKSELDDNMQLIYLQRLTEITSCYSAGNRNKKLYVLYKSLLEEAFQLAENSEQKQIIKSLCESVAYVSVRENGHPTSSEIDKKIKSYTSTYLPECLAIEFDPLEKKRLLNTLMSNDSQAIKKILNESFYSIDTRFDDHRTALAIASIRGNTESIETLIKLGADPNTMDKYNRLILQQVIFFSKSYERKIEILKTTNFPPEQWSIHYRQSINPYTKKNSSPQPVRELPMTEKEKEIAIETKAAEIITLLIKHGADPHQPDAWNNTPFHTAVQNDKLIIAAEMIKAGANVNDTESDNPEFFYNYERKPILFEVKSIAMAKLLLDAGADINSQTKLGNTALIHASMVGNIELVKFLIDRGADVNIKNSNKRTALYYAKNAEIRKLLLKSHN